MTESEVNVAIPTVTWGKVARRPQWIVALIAVMLVAAAFAWLGKWQLERAVLNAQVTDYQTETVVPLSSLAQPASYLTDAAGGHMVTVDASLDTSTLMVLDGRYNDGKPGYWVIGRATTPDGMLPVALGWTSTAAQADEVIARFDVPSADQALAPSVLTPVIGRLMPAEAPTEPKSDQNPQTMTTMAVAQLVNIWPATEASTYFAYLVAKDAPSGATAIVSTAPISDTSLNWLNVFYAVEWLVFAGFAFFLWYRLVKDAKQREEDAQSLVE